MDKPLPEVKVVDTMGAAERLLQSGAERIASITTEVLQKQLQSSSSELRVLSEVTTVATSKYEELRPPIQQLGTFYDNLTDKLTGLEPALQKLDRLEGEIEALERLTSGVISHCKELEQGFADLGVPVPGVQPQRRDRQGSAPPALSENVAPAAPGRP